MKNHIFFLQINSAGIWSFLYYQEKWYFFFPKISSFSLDGKWGTIFLKKVYGDMIFFSNTLKRWSFQKRLRWNMIFLVFFSGKYDIFSLDGKWKMVFLNKYMEIWYFVNICINVTNMIKKKKKNQRSSSPEKIHLKVIEYLDRILERVPTILCTFMKTFIGVFIDCFPVKKNKQTNKQTRNLIYRTEISLLLQFIWLKIFYYSALRNCIYRCTWATNREIIYLRGKNLLSVEVNRTFLKVHAKNLVKVTRIGEVIGRKRPPTLRKLSFKFRH